MFGIGGKKRKETAEYTVISCTACGALQKRKFAAGDTVFESTSNTCKSCKGESAVIQQIFSEEIE